MGLDSPTKKLAFRILLDLEKVDVIFLQEKLGSNIQIYSLLEGLKPGWTFHALDVLGRYGGIVVGFDRITTKFLFFGGGMVF